MPNQHVRIVGESVSKVPLTVLTAMGSTATSFGLAQGQGQGLFLIAFRISSAVGRAPSAVPFLVMLKGDPYLGTRRGRPYRVA